MNTLQLVRWGSFLFAICTAKVVAFTDSCSIRNDVEIIPVTRSHGVSRACHCNISSVTCLWKTFADRTAVSHGEMLMWSSDNGYGQFSCIEDQSTVVQNVLIIPENTRESCRNCINAMVCMNTTGGPYLDFSTLFNTSLIDISCLLYLNDDVVDVFTEEMCVQLSSNSNYSIVCPVCNQVVYSTIYFKIPNSMFHNIQDCSNSGICGFESQLISTSTAVPTSTFYSIDLSTRNFPITSSYLPDASTTGFATLLTMTPTNSAIGAHVPITTNEDNDLGVILGATLGTAAVLLAVIVLVVLLYCFRAQRRRRTRHLQGEMKDDNVGIICNNPNDNNHFISKEEISQLLDYDASQLISGITEIHPTINQHLKFETLIPFLNKYKIFTHGEMECFHSKSNAHEEKVNNLIRWLNTKAHDGIIKFVKALNEENQHSGHRAILKELHKTLFPEIKVTAL